MKKYLLIILSLCLIATLAFAVDTTYGPKVYKTDGGDKQVIASGGTIDVESGGILAIAGTTVTATAAELNKLASLSGDVLSTTNTKTVTNKTLSGATLANTITLSGATLTGGATMSGTYTGGKYSASEQASPTLSGTVTSSGATMSGTFTGGTYATVTLSGTTTLSGSTLSGGATMSGTFTGGTYSGATLSSSPVVNFGISPKTFIAGEDWTLSSAEAKSVLLTLASGSGTPSIIDAFSASGAVKIIRNAANVAVTCKMSGQTGVSVASGKTAILMNSGTDYIRVTADETH